MKIFRLIALILIAASTAGAALSGQDDRDVWREFVGLLKAGRMTADRIRPEKPLTPESQLAILRGFSKNAVWEEWEAEPKIVRYGDRLTFLVTLGKSVQSPRTYSLNFLIENGRWFYRFVEGIVLPLDRIGPLPASAANFLELPKDQMLWIQQESYWSEQVRLFNFLTHEKGRDTAFRWIETGLANGVGYALAASVWIPFYPTHRAFILYLCWEQAKFGGNNVTLEKLTDNEAVVLFQDSIYFSLYMIATHLKNQISLEDYIKIFETIWQARARAAGWNLVIDGQGQKIYFRFSR